MLGQYGSQHEGCRSICLVALRIALDARGANPF